jgi:hypothetical protein
MTLSALQTSFNRALYLLFSRAKFLLTFGALLVCGFIYVFFQGIAVDNAPWLQQCLTFLALFIDGMLLMAVGVLLIRIHHDEIKQREVNLRNLISNSWELLVAPFTYLLPFILAFLILWIVLGLFVLLYEIPLVGSFFEIILGFAPFVIQFVALLLCSALVASLFFVTPLLALKGWQGMHMYQTFMQRLQTDLFSHLLLLVVGIIPILFIVSLLVLSAFLTGFYVEPACTPLTCILQGFFIMIPFVALLTPFVIFFFNFSAEAHVLLQRQAAPHDKHS